MATLKYCDIVMKGGITSGVVYPPAITELAREYQFKNIGGASAGAIAAAATAAAEYGRQTGKGTAFTGLSEISSQLTKSGFLLKLFTPDHGTAPLFKVLIRVMERTSSIGKVVAGLLGLIGSFRFA